MELWCYAFRYRNHSIFPLLFFVLNTFSSSYFFSYVDRRNGKKVVDSWYCSLRCVFEGACVADCRMKFSGYKVEKIDCRMKKTWWRMKKKVAVNFRCQNGEFVATNLTKKLQEEQLMQYEEYWDAEWKNPPQVTVQLCLNRTKSLLEIQWKFTWNELLIRNAGFL